MIRSRSFHLVSRTNISSWSSFDEAIEHIVQQKAEIEKTFANAAFDHNFNEPMNALILECDSKNPVAANINTYAEKVNKIFENSDDKIVIDVRLFPFPAKMKKRVCIEHTYFIKEAC